MAETSGVVSLLLWLFTLLVLLGLSALSFYRLRATASGLLLGGSFALRALGMVMLRIISGPIGSHFGAYSWMGWRSVIVSLCGAGLGLLLILGLVLLPRSLRRLGG
jgi:hypothetical protein